MKISIIVPTFNAAKTISECLSSITRQTYKNFEILIVDGSSSDDTVKIAETFLSKTSQLKIISEPDRGIYDAMNKAVSLSTGSWVYFLGSDDTFYSELVLEKITPWLEHERFQVVYCDIMSSRFNGRYGGEFSATRILFENICHQAIFFHRNIFQKSGLFDLRYKAHADWDHNIRWRLDASISSKYVPLVIANYADGGYSSIHGDTEFEKVKLRNYLYYAAGSVPFWKKLRTYLAYQRRKLHEKRYGVFMGNLKTFPLLFKCSRK